MEKLYTEVLVVLGNVFRRLEQQIPPPKPQPWNDWYVYRCREKELHQAIIQKMARMVSGLNAVLCLLQNGFLQEQGVIQRTLDDLGEDIFLLIGAINEGEMAPIHEQFLANFFAEEFDPAKPGVPIARPAQVERKRIRAYNVRTFNPEANRSKTLDVHNIVASAYSGYVHAASPHIMDMYSSDQKRFLVEGMLGTPRMEEHRDDAWNYYLRGLFAARAIAKAFGDAPLSESLRQFVEKFEKESDSLRHE